jgi:hypothetical protein
MFLKKARLLKQGVKFSSFPVIDEQGPRISKTAILGLFFRRQP